MANVVRKGDINGAGGVALVGASSVTAEGNNVSLPGDSVTAHPCCGSPGCGAHCSATLTGGSSSVFVEGKPVIHNNDIDSCGHKRATFASSVFVGT